MSITGKGMNMRIAVLHAQIIHDELRNIGFVKINVDGKEYGVNEVSAISAIGFFNEEGVDFPYNDLCYDPITLASRLRNGLYQVENPIRRLIEIDQMLFGNSELTEKLVAAFRGYTLPEVKKALRRTIRS